MMVNRRAFQIALLVLACGVCFAASAQSVPGGISPVVRVNAIVHPQSVQIEAKAGAAFDYVTYRPSDNLFVVDLTGVTAGAPSGAQVLKSDLVSSFRVLQYRSGDHAIVRVEVLMRSPLEPVIERQGQDGLLISFNAKSVATPVAAKKTVAAPVPNTVSTKNVAPAKSAIIATGNAIQQVRVEQIEKQTQVRIEGNGRLSYETMRLLNPDRLVLDFGGTKAHVARPNLTSSLDPVHAVRVGQFKSDVTRVVIELAHGSAYNVNAVDKSVLVTFGTSTAKLSTPAEEKAFEPAVTQTVPAIALAQVAPPPAPPVEPVQKKEEVVTAGQTMSLPESLTKSGSALATLAPAALPPVKAVTTENRSASATPAPQPVAAVPTAASFPQGDKKYSGEPVSVNLKDVDLKDFFRLIHEISGLNIVLDPGVRGSVTIVLDDVPWDQALDIVLKNNSLDKQLEGNVLRIVTLDTMKKEAETSRDLQKAKAEAVPQITVTRTLSYSKSADVKDTLKRFLSSRGEILSDDRSNTLIIRDIPSVIPDIDNLIRQLDRKSQQVEIEARVVSATRTFAREIGTQFGFATSSTGGRSVYGGLVGASGFSSPVQRGAGLPLPPLVSSGSNSIPLMSNLAATVPNSGATFSHASPNFALDFIISAAESKGVGKLISKPRVITQNNVKATIKQGTKIPIQTVINNTISVQFIDALLKMEVTPQITAEGTIFMDIQIDNTKIDDGIVRINGTPALATQFEETKVLVSDGGTVVIGGVISSTQRTTVSQVPLFGSIPLIGNLFKHTSVASDSQELLFFITPRIVSN
ncbi:MAG: type IV pilus secretin PilQ [Acidobacteria bacterium]|nr:type IV pilus secretin PilQ [Acidobacteriota bacterium]